MSYMALYRKWRPKDFDDVIGQDHIVRTLKNQIFSERISHAYLFCGTRGTGKTSMAKIFAKAINCENTQDGSPCNTCELCVDLAAGRSMNIIEIDAASNNGVDNIRDIREEVKYAPTEGKYKVYIIDEVHMLSMGAFNALLKTLEEPPPHIIFILATTDPHKIPATILSRCQRFDFRRIPSVEIAKKMQYYMEEEGIKAEEKAIAYIARISDGAMRDALSVLDQCISFHHKETITLEKVLDIVGSVDQQVFFSLTEAVVKRDSKRCMEIVEEIVMAGRDIRQFVGEFVIHFRNLLVARTTQNLEQILNLSRENIEILQQQAKQIPGNTIIRYIRAFSELENQLKYASQGRILVEVALIKLCQPSTDGTYEGMLERIQALEQKLEQGVWAQKTSPGEKTAAAPPSPPKPKPRAVPQDIKDNIKIWNEVKRSFDRPMAAMLNDTEAGYLEDVFYYILCPNTAVETYVYHKADKIGQKLEQTAGKKFEIKPILTMEYNRQYKVLYGEGTTEQEEVEDPYMKTFLQDIHESGVPVQTVDE